MNLQKKPDLLKNKIHRYNKEFQIFKFLSLNYSNCHPTYGDFNDKENIN